MARDVTKGGLSAARRGLVETMQWLTFGRIERLVIRDGEPVENPAARIVREVKFGTCEQGPRGELGMRDFALKLAVRQLFEQFDRVRDGVIELIEVRHGLPHRMSFEGRLSA